MTVTPIVVFAYRRPDLLARTLAAARSEMATVLYAFSDGPRTPHDADAVREVRRVISAVDWAEVRLVARETNMGLSRSILDGVTRVLAEHDRAVILEDDIELAPGGFEWIAAALEHYRDDARVLTVSAWTHPRVTPPGLDGRPFFSARADAWGWGTWARGWNGMLDNTAVEFLAQAEQRGMRPGAYGDDLVRLAVAEEEGTMWDARLVVMHFAKGGLALHPAEPYARHIGWDPRATHGTVRDRWDSPMAPRAVIPGQWPDAVEDSRSAALWRRAVEEDDRADRAARSLPARIRRYIGRHLGGLLGRDRP